LHHVGFNYVTLLLNCELVSRAKLCLVSVFTDTLKDFPKIRNIPKIFLRSFENVAPYSYYRCIMLGLSLRSCSACSRRSTQIWVWVSESSSLSLGSATAERRWWPVKRPTWSERCEDVIGDVRQLTAVTG